jgi:hypothetical protein
MKRLFIAAAALSMVTVGVMANAKRFANAGIYAVVSGTNVQLTNAETFNRNLVLSNAGVQAKIIGSASSTQYPLVYDNGIGTITNVTTINLP